MPDGRSGVLGVTAVPHVEEEPGSGFGTARNPASLLGLAALGDDMLWNSAT